MTDSGRRGRRGRRRVRSVRQGPVRIYRTPAALAASRDRRGTRPGRWERLLKGTYPTRLDGRGLQSRSRGIIRGFPFQMTLSERDSYPSPRIFKVLSSRPSRIDFNSRRSGFLRSPLPTTDFGFLIFASSSSGRLLSASGIDERWSLTYFALLSMALTRPATMLRISFTLCSDMGFEYSIPINGRN